MQLFLVIEMKFFTFFTPIPLKGVKSTSCLQKSPLGHSRQAKRFQQIKEADFEWCSNA